MVLEEKQFKYTISYFNDVINIECLHLEEYFIWRGIFEGITSINNFPGSFSQTISSALLFKLLKEYKNSTLHPIYRFVFPESSKNRKTNLVIELIIKMPYEEMEDYKMIVLIPGKIDESQRFDYKLNKTKIALEEKYNINTNFQKELDELKRYFDDEIEIFRKKN